MTITLSKYQKVEGALHLLFWVFIFSSVNVSWQENWFNVSIRPNSPSPVSVICFPVLFYLHAFWAIPKYLYPRKWLDYGLCLVLIFILPELIRLVFYAAFFNRPVQVEYLSRDSLLFGAPSIVWLAFISSLIYKLITDRLASGNQLKNERDGSRKNGAQQAIVQESEAQVITSDLIRLMTEDKIFLQNDLTLSALSEQLHVSDKKLSGFINSHLGTNFTDYINNFRIEHFISESESGKLEYLSIAGLAYQCGFSSKTTFYRAFKKVKGCTPTEYFKM